MHSTRTSLLSALIVLGLFALALPLAPAVAQNEQWSDTIVCTALKYNLRYGSTDRYTRGEVSTLQGFLQAKGYLNAPKSGFFGPLTLKAAKQYQALNGLPPTGWVWTLTRAKIKAETCGSVGSTAITGPTAPRLGQPQPATPPQTTHPAPPLTPTPTTPVPLPTPVPESSGFTWGVNAHPLYESHRNISAAEHLDAVKGLGMTSLRVDVYDATPTTLARLDTYVAEGKKRGISILPVISLQVIGYSSDSIKSRAYSFGHTLASRYKNDIHVWELSNELDNYSMIKPCETRDNGTVYSCSYGDPDGESPLDYKKSRYEEARTLFQGLGEGVRAADPSARRIIDFSAWHIGFIERLVADGVPFEIVGWHFYNGEYSLENVNGVNLIQKIAVHGKPIWFTEFNKWQGSRTGESEQTAELQKLMDHFTKLAKTYKITGAHIYELYDNPNEMDFGLIKLTSAGGAGAKKPAYEAVRSRILGTAGQTPPAIEVLGTPPQRTELLGTPPRSSELSATITQSKTTTATGETFSVSWDSTNATSCVVDYSLNGGSSWVPWTSGLSGSQTSTPSNPGTLMFRAICEGAAGAKSASITHTVTGRVTTSAPIRPDPAVKFTINDKDTETLSLGNPFTYLWSAANADSYTSSYTATCSNGASFGGPWIASTAEGREEGRVSDQAGLGCTYKLTYTATQSGSDKQASKTITVVINK